jgi:hypothetical protein
MSVLRGSISRGTAALAVLLGVSLFSSAPALAAPEAPVTGTATGVEATEATLHGELNPHTEALTGYEFTYNDNGTCEGFTTKLEPEADVKADKVSALVTGLEPSKEYMFCVVATNATPESTSGQPVPFTTLAAPPKAGKEIAVVTPFTARLEELVNPNNQVTRCELQYGKTTAYGNRVPCEPASLEGFGEQGVVNAAGLEPETTYHFRVIAVNAAHEKTVGADHEFTTLTLEKPIVVASSEKTETVTPFEATLEAQVNPNYQETTYFFEYATSKAAIEAKAGTPVIGAGPLAAEFGEPTVGVPTGVLTPATTYYYRVVATNATGTEEGSIESFTTLTLKNPLIEGPVSTSAFGQTTASLTGTVNPEYQVTTACEFQYATEEAALAGTPPSAPCEPSASELGQVGYGLPVSASLAGLLPNTTYYYRLFVENAKGPKGGTPEHFLTLPNPPTATTGGTSSIAPNSATIEGTVNPGAKGYSEQDKTTYYFQYGHTTGYGEPTPAGEAGEGEIAVKETASVTGLEPNTTYHYRIVAVNNANTTPQTTYGKDGTFTTVSTPPIIGEASVSDVTESAAKVATTLDARGLPTRWELLLGSTEGSLEFQAAGNSTGSGAQPLEVNLEPLAPGTTYYYKIVAVNPDGTTPSAEGKFTTVAAPAASFTELTTTPQLKFPKEEAEPPKKTTNAEKLQKALKACGKKRSKSKRATCVRHARKEFGRSKK